MATHFNGISALATAGSAAATFSRILPYGGTPIRDQLQKEGRLRGDLTHPDYVFLDARLNDYHRLLSQTVRPWRHGEGLSYQLEPTRPRLVPNLDVVRQAAPRHRQP
jgi:hypothetical protein